jgi:hypothetical protein
MVLKKGLGLWAFLWFMFSRVEESSLGEKKKMREDLHPEDTETVGCSWHIAEFVELSGITRARTKADGCIARRWIIWSIFGIICTKFSQDVGGKLRNSFPMKRDTNSFLWLTRSRC